MQLLPYRGNSESSAHEDSEAETGDDSYMFAFTNSRGQDTNYLQLSTSTLSGMIKSQRGELVEIEKKIKEGAPEKLHKKLKAKLEDSQDDDFDDVVRSPLR